MWIATWKGTLLNQFAAFLNVADILDFIYRGSLFSIFTTLIYHKVLINNNTEQDTEQDKQIKLLVDDKYYGNYMNTDHLILINCLNHVRAIT